MKIFTDYSEPLHNYLRMLGNDVSRIDDLIATGRQPTFICSHHRANGGWAEGLSATDNPRTGEYLDEKMTMVNPNEFYEQFGGERYVADTPKKRISIVPKTALRTTMAFLLR